VNGTGSATFGLHFKHAGNLSPNILLACSTPVVGVLSHRTRRCNRVNCRDFANRKRNASGSFVTVTRNHLFCHGYLQFLGFFEKILIIYTFGVRHTHEGQKSTFKIK
jgi:hypothetical protein